MRVIINQILLIILYFACFSAGNTHAAYISCTTLPVDVDSYLKDDTAYGYIQENLFMKDSDQGINYCDYLVDSKEFKFCVADSSGLCDVKTKAVGDNFTLSSISSQANPVRHKFLESIPLSVKLIDSKICLTMPTSRGFMPIMCRTTMAQKTEETNQERICRTIGESCYAGAPKSQSLLSFSGLTVHCMRDTLDKVMYMGSECAFEDSISYAVLSPFSSFQSSMKNTVLAALMLYVMFYGFKLVMNIEYAELNKIAIFIVKFIFVLYFAIGIGSKTLEDGTKVPQNGMTEMALPILVDMTNLFADIVFSAGGSQGLCMFDVNKYDKGYSFYRIWDAIDCRVGYYMGMQILYNASAVSSNSNAPKTLEQGAGFALFIVLAGFVMGGQILIVMFGIVFAVMFISVVIYFITTYLICMITLYVMAYISPIFIPMVLFERTKSYFDAWLRTVISCTLQPAVIGAFIALLLTMYDSAIYGNCEFKRHDHTLGNMPYSTFELVLPSVDVEKCEDSAGYKLLRYYQGKGWHKKSFIIFSASALKDSLDLASSLLYTMIYMFIFYFFVQRASEFASDLTGGSSVATVTAKPMEFWDNNKQKAFGAAKGMGKMYAKGVGKAVRAPGRGYAYAKQKSNNSASRNKASTRSLGNNKGGSNE
ncbi:MAG: type IV secretion system protein [Rickettsiaceae bacterium]|nr:type IV secretion system protein [Rickettsiaceae bacterium]